MKYLPVHKAMIPFLKEGMTLIHYKRWSICDVTVVRFTAAKNCYTRVVVTCGKDAQRLDTADMLQMYISVNDIRKLRAFGGDKYIAKYSAYRVTNPHANGLPTHAQLKALVGSTRTLPLQYLPINHVLAQELKVGTRVLFSGGMLTGTKRRITSDTLPCELKSAHSRGIETGDTGFVYSREWFADNVYVAVEDIMKMRRGEEYCTAYAAYKVTNLVTKGPTFDEMRVATLGVENNKLSFMSSLLTMLATHGEAAAKEPKQHQFKATPPNQQGKWVAFKTKVSLSMHSIITAESEAGLKAKLALRLAEYPNEEYDIFCQVGGAKTKHSTPEIVFTNVGE